MIMTGGKKASTFPLLQGLGIRRRFHSAGKLFSAMLHDYWREPSIYRQPLRVLRLFFTDAYCLGVRASRP